MRYTLIEAEVDLSRAAEMVGFDADAFRGLIQEGLIKCGAGNRSPLKFTDVCQAMATLNFRHAFGTERNQGESSPVDHAAQMCMLPMAAFASNLAEARYGFEGNLVRTTHPSHVPERYVALHGNRALRFGTLEAFERARELESPRYAIFIFDTKAAAEHLVNELRTTPFRWAKVEGDG